jgi:DNA-binding transcriptional LysR family regulator
VPTIKQIQHFRAVFESGTVQAAAEAAHISQPALTRSISNLENELGLPLFDRSRSGMLPTEFAEQIAPRFAELLLELDDIQREALLFRQLEAGQLSIGLGQAIREPLLRRCLPRFVEQFPGISLKVREGTAPELARALQQREVDMIVAGVASYTEYEFVTSDHILDIPVLVMVRHGHPLANRERVTVEELLNYPQAAPTVLGSQHPFRRRLIPAQGRSLDPHFLCSDYATLESIVTRTDAWTVTLETKLHRDPPSSLRPLSVSDFDITIELSVIELKKRSRSPAADRFIETIKSILVA